MQVPEIKNKAIKNANKTLFENGTQSCSRQQRYIHSLLGGKLNYLFDKVWLDIAFLDEKIYIEYQGSGHDIGVKYNKISQKKFQQNEMKRYYFLKSNNWKMIEIVSKNDYLPSDNTIIDATNFAIQKIHEGNNWVRIDIDSGYIELKNKIINYDFGDCNLLKNTNLQLRIRND